MLEIQEAALLLATLPNVHGHGQACLGWGGWTVKGRKFPLGVSSAQAQTAGPF